MALVAYALTTVAKVKASLGITSSSFDSLFETYINSCTEWIEAECGGRRFKSTGVDQVELLNGGMDGGNILFPKQYPIVSITSIELNGGSQGNPSWEAIDAIEYTADLEGGMIYLNSSLAKGYSNYRLTYEAGFTTVPLDIELACIKLVSKEFDKRRSQGITNEGTGGASAQWNESWQGTITQDFYLIIRKYRRF